MRWFQFTTLAHVLSVLANPIAQEDSMLASDIQVLEYNNEAAYARFELAPGLHGWLTSPLVFELQVNPSGDALSSNITLNDQLLDTAWDSSHPSQSQTFLVPSKQVISVPEKLGFSHSLAISLAGSVDIESDHQSPSKDVTQNITLRIDSVDSISVQWSLNIITNPVAASRLLGLTGIHSPFTLDSTHSEGSSMVAQPISDNAIEDEPPAYDEITLNIEAEIESLLLLEAEADDLQAVIEDKKKAIAKCMKNHRDHVTLNHLLHECDGLVCAAKVIAQKICDKVGILTMPDVGYAKVQDLHSQHLFDSEHTDAKSGLRITSSEKNPDSSMRMSNAHSDVGIQSIRVVYPQSVLFRVLGVIASALGLAALFAFIRRRCMSVRTRTERAADKEERRNARAYRRAARRAEMRRRWDAFVMAINCFRSPSEPRMEDYEEKRALILQEAFLEQGLDVAEKGQVMDAEIRELRHAHEIVASLVRVDDRRYGIVVPVNDPPPPLVPLPYTPGDGRSRASTATLPSYTSEILPDYTSRYARTETTASSNVSLRSHSISATTDLFLLTSSTATSESGHHTGSTSRTHSPEGSHSSQTSRTSRYTPTSSVIEVSPRVSGETLHTVACRLSREVRG